MSESGPEYVCGLLARNQRALMLVLEAMNACADKCCEECDVCLGDMTPESQRDWALVWLEARDE